MDNILSSTDRRSVALIALHSFRLLRLCVNYFKEKVLARIVKEYDERHEELLNTAQTLFYTKGYSHTSVHDIIDTIGIAKGTFYHYFDSKVALLEALVTQLTNQVLRMLDEVVDDDSLDALTKLTRIFNFVGNWKTERKAELMIVMRAIYRDENILLMHKMKEKGFTAVIPTLTRVIEQGISEGVFDVNSAEDTAEIFLQTSQGLSEGFARILLNLEDYDDPAALVRQKKAAYETAIERILGAPGGSLSLFDEAIIDAWFE
jgi:AcrR family transcriptional regulator